ncbi:MAG: tRNA pseudouridine(55) synthase TruB [Bacteroidales bacterium]|jgi:tRNA pseudouridine55 synthase|nr:tRNA pseudouridine(55) synthase TruB [Bacteroidales bacterium]
MVNLKIKYDFLGGEVLLFDKNINWTSFDLVQKVRNVLCRKMGIKKLKVGHAGTLDPLATGLMILCTGRATKRIEEFQNGTKEYIATLKIGATTPSFDMETDEDSVFDFSHVTEKKFEDACLTFIGETNQVPPVFSAVKVNGKRAFDYAREGKDLKLKPKKIIIETIETTAFEPPFVKIKIVCSKGTYIRALARDIGKELKCGAYLSELRRTKIGEFNVEDAVNIDTFMNNIDDFEIN